MEPIVLFGAGVVGYCGYLAFRDFLADMGWHKAKQGRIPGAVRTVITPPRKAPSATAGQGDGVAARWPARLADSF
jgi:hypothetical protein